MSTTDNYYFDRAGLLLAKQARKQEIGSAAYEAALVAKAERNLAAEANDASGASHAAETLTINAEGNAPSKPANAADRLAAFFDTSARTAGFDAAHRVRNLGNMTTVIAAQDPTIARINAMLYGTPEPAAPPAEQDITAEADEIPHGPDQSSPNV